MSRQATNHIIGQLEALGYLERRAARKRERRRIYLTPRTWGMVKVVHATLLEFKRSGLRRSGRTASAIS